MAISQDLWLLGLSYEVGAERTLADLAPGREEQVSRLAKRGCRLYRDSSLTVGRLAALSINRTLKAWGGRPQDIDLVVFSSATISNDTKSDLYDSLRRAGCGLEHAPVVGLAMPGCARLHAALEFARALVATGRMRTVLVVTSDRWSDEPRIDPDGLYVGGDGAASGLVTCGNDLKGLRLLGMGLSAEQRTLLAGNGPRSLDTIAKIGRGLRSATSAALLEANVAPEAVGQVFTAHVCADVMRSYAQSAGLDGARVFLGSMPQFGHCFAADPIIGLLEWDRSRTTHAATTVALLQPAPSTWATLVGLFVS